MVLASWQADAPCDASRSDWLEEEGASRPGETGCNPFVVLLSRSIAMRLARIVFVTPNELLRFEFGHAAGLALSLDFANAKNR